MKNVEIHCLLLLCYLMISCCSEETDCHQKVDLITKERFVPYQGNEQLKFLHNNSDTQVFIGQGKETYYAFEARTNPDECSKDYECIRIKFINQSTKDVFTLAYERDQQLFPYNTLPWYMNHGHTFYKLSYKNKMFYNLLYFSDTNLVFINKISYPTVLFIGEDTATNYVAYRIHLGLLRIRVNNENWDVIP